MNLKPLFLMEKASTKELPYIEALLKALHWLNH